jgi:predicted AAA+ superfamily ATPase
VGLKIDVGQADLSHSLKYDHSMFEILTRRVKISNMFYPRNLKSALTAAAGDTPIILINGARQTGKSTLLTTLEAEESTEIVSLDDLTVLQAIQSNAQAYLTGLQAKRIVFDEIQRAPELFLPLKEAVDRRREPGRFFLTGSANVLTLPRLADTLAGRMEILSLWPLSQGELHQRQEGFIDLAFTDDPFPQCASPSLTELIERLLAGGYPEVLSRPEPRRRATWFRSYINTILQRDVQELSRIEGLAELPNLLALIASRTGGLLNAADLSRSLGLSNPTLQRYIRLLESVFLIVSVPPWFANLGKRLVKAPRLYLNDTGLLCHLLGLDAETLSGNRNHLGPVFENFAVLELLKQTGWSSREVRLSHYRTHAGQEVDVILEAGQRVVGLEIKAASSLTPDHFKGLRHLKEALGERFHRGVILYTGSRTVAFDEKLWACPISALWEANSIPAQPLI